MTAQRLLQVTGIAAALGIAAFVLPSCGGGDSTGGGDDPGQGSEAETADDGPRYDPSLDYTIPTVRYAWNPDAGDPSVSAEDGGPGFTGEGWETNMDALALGDPNAKKGGQITIRLLEWPVNMRFTGANWNIEFNYRAADLVMEALLHLHPHTNEYAPWLATHWQIEPTDNPEEEIYRYRINPEARWSDGMPVTADDVVATYRLFMDETIDFPSNQLVYGKFHEPVAVSKYIVEVRCKQRNWRNFLYFSNSLTVMPAHVIGDMTGAEYLETYQYAYPPVSGPYTLDPEFELNQSVSLVRRDDWWGEENPAWSGAYNFDRYHFVVVREEKLAFEKFKAGEFDYYVIPKAQWWVEDLPEVDGVQRGLIQPRKYYNNAPRGYSGFAFNMTRPPLDDLNVRLALAHLQDRPTYIDKLFFNEYEALHSYFPGRTYANPGNVPVEYDPVRAVELLEESGWTEIGGDGIRKKDGRRLSFEASYRSELSEPFLTTYQEDARQAGVDIRLQRLDSTQYWRNVRAREYDLGNQAWGALVFPNPETSWSGELAKVDQNNNLTAFSDPRVDALLDEYDRAYDLEDQIRIIREIDGLIYDQHPYALAWYLPCERVVYWNRFAMPDFGVWATSDRHELMYSWWIDEEKDALVQRGKSDSTVTMEALPIEDYWWEGWNDARERTASAAEAGASGGAGR